MAEPAPTDPKPPGPDPAAVAWAKVRGHLDKLFGALDDLDEAGGLRAAAKAGSWSPRAHAKALGSLEAVRGQLEAALARAGSGLTRSSDKADPGRVGRPGSPRPKG